MIPSCRAGAECWHGRRARGAVDADAKTGDGAGVMTQIPYKLFRPVVEKLGHKLYNDADLGVGMVFLPHDNAYMQARAKAIIEETFASAAPSTPEPAA